MGITKLMLDVPDDKRGGVYSNLAIVVAGDEETTLNFYLMDGKGNEDGKPYEEGVLQARVIMPKQALRILGSQIQERLKNLEQDETDAR